MIGVREREATIDLTGAGAAAGRDHRREIVRALMFANGIDERGRRLPLAIDRAPASLRSRRPAPTAARLRDQRAAAIYAQADLDDGQPNVRIIGRAPSSSPATGERRLSRGARSTRRSSDPSRDSVVRSRSRTSGTATYLTIGNTALAPQDLSQVDRHEVARSQADLRLVPRPVSMWGRRLTVLFWTLFIVGLLFLAVVMHATLAERQGQLDDTHVRVERAERDHELLRIDVARLESPERITAIAARMGLVTPQRIRFVSPSGTITGSDSSTGSGDVVAAGSGAAR